MISSDSKALPWPKTRHYNAEILSSLTASFHFQNHALSKGCFLFGKAVCCSIAWRESAFPCFRSGVTVLTQHNIQEISVRGYILYITREKEKKKMYIINSD